MRERNLSSYFSIIMMILLVIITFSFYDGLFMSSIVLSLPWDGPPDFWFWVDWWCYHGRNILFVIIWAEVVIHLAWSSYMSLKRSCIWMKDLYSLLREVASRCTNCLWPVISGGFLLRLPGLSNFHHPWGEFLLIRSRSITCPVRLTEHTTIYFFIITF